MEENKLRSVSLRSEELEEMLMRPPAWLTRWGASMFTAIILLITMLSWFVKSPDRIAGSCVLTTENPPISLSSRNSGKLQHLLAADHQMLQADDIIAEIENPTGMKEMRYLNDITTRIVQDLSTGRVSFDNLVADPDMTFGDAQSDYNNLIKNCQEYQNLVTNPFYRGRIDELRRQLLWQTQLVGINASQSRIFESQLRNAKTKFAIEEKLHDENVYSDVEHLQQEEMLLGKLMENENYKKATVQGQITILDLKKQIHELEFEFGEKQRGYRNAMLEAVKNLQNFSKQWQRVYTIRATSSGMLTYLKPLHKNEYVKAEEELFAIVQDHGDYIAYATVNSAGAGKIRRGQRVKLKLDNYPHQQYGALEGVVDDISLLPQAAEDKQGDKESNGAYRVTIRLVNKLVTDYNVRIGFKPNMSGQAEIMTAELRLLERLLYNVRAVIDR